MHKPFPRRAFLSSIAGLPTLPLLGTVLNTKPGTKISSGGNRLKTSLNAYSFNDPLIKGNMSLDDLLDFCARTGFDGVDITGYYFKGYPLVPSDDYLFQIKRKALSVAVEITGTGVRNDFTIPDKNKRQGEIDLVKKWIEVAARIGAPIIRIFAGNYTDKTFTREQVMDWMLKDIQTCVDHAKQYGVVVGLQNHNDFIQTADQVNQIIESINSEWFGLILDTGSYRINDPYEEIEKSIKHAVNWQIKEKIFLNGAEVDTDISRIIRIVKASDYNGYLPIETLGAGDPKVKVPVLFEKLRKALAG